VIVTNFLAARIGCGDGEKIRQVHTMSNMNADETEKVNAYFKIIDERIIAPIQNTDVRKSCTATLALLFSAIDGLGTLTCQDDDFKYSNTRFKSFLKLMGKKYKKYSDKLWGIRNGLVHNGVNLESYMFATSESDFVFEHLSTRGPNGFLYIDTTRFFSEFCEAKRKLRKEISQNKELLKRAANRLEWLSEEAQEDSEDETPRPSSPPPVGFIHLKKEHLNQSPWKSFSVGLWKELYKLYSGKLSPALNFSLPANKQIRWIFRAESSEANLRTSLEKAVNDYAVPDDKRPEYEMNIIRKFQRKASLYIEHEPHKDDVLEWLALMRHHGAATRLMDWTYSFFIAVYFALAQRPEGGIVWALNVGNIFEPDPVIEKVKKRRHKKNLMTFMRDYQKL